ncbi:MAG: glycine cleavage T C-terminal barrel domain-containing protein [Pseudomonadota bacterium]
MTAGMYITARIRKSPFFDSTVAAGASEFSVYNKTYLPGYPDPEGQFWALVEDVALWDVTCQRVVEISGPDAFAFMDRLTPRNLAKCQVGHCRYVLLTDRGGGILNDPVLMRLAEDRFWLSSADGDVAMWARGVAVEGRHDVRITKPDVATLQLQGPKSTSVLQALIGDSVLSLSYYHHREAEIDGIPILLARTGFSAERGYELYLLDTARGGELWQFLMEAGRDHGIRPGSPSRIRRIEAGILDYGVDMNETTNPFEVGLGRLVDLSPEADYIGKAALQRIKAEGIKRKIVGLEIEGSPVGPNDVSIPIEADGQAAGYVTSWIYSPRLEGNIGLAMLNLAQSELGSRVEILAGGGPRAATVVPTPFVDPEKWLART